MKKQNHLWENPYGPVVITVYKDKKFDFIIKSPPASHFIRERSKIKRGSQRRPGRVIAGSTPMKQAGSFDC